MKKRKPPKKTAEETSLLELLDRVEAAVVRLRAENRRLRSTKAKLAADQTKTAPVGKPPALGRGLSQLFGGPKRG